MNTKKTCPIEDCDNEVKLPFSLCIECISKGHDNYRGSNLKIIIKQ
jgi:hypothetical protein